MLGTKINTLIDYSSYKICSHGLIALTPLLHKGLCVGGPHVALVVSYEKMLDNFQELLLALLLRLIKIWRPTMPAHTRCAGSAWDVLQCAGEWSVAYHSRYF